MRRWRIILVIVAVVSFGVAMQYPIREYIAARKNNTELEALSAMRQRALPTETPAVSATSGAMGKTAEELTPEEIQSLEQDKPLPVETEATSANEQSFTNNAQADDAPPFIEQKAAASAETPEKVLPDATIEDASTVMEWGSTLPAVEQESISRGAELQNAPAFAALEATLPAMESAETTPDVEPEAVSRDEDSKNAPTSIALESTQSPILSEVTPYATVLEEASSGVEPANTTATELPLLELNLPTAATAEPMVPDRTPDIHDYILYDVPGRTPEPSPTPRVTPSPTPAPSPTPNRSVYDSDVLPYSLKEKVVLDASLILLELRDIYRLNNDLVGWLFIPGTNVDYPVVQCEDMEYYLHHDFYGEKNVNGQLILNARCDPYTPSYNLIISGHHMNNGSMFGRLTDYKNESYWNKHKIVEFDSLMERKQYVVFAAFYSADYDEDETGFRYSADIGYRLDANQWLDEIRKNQVYDTGIEVEFGDEFLTLTTCSRTHRKDGRFVVVCRRIRKGEEFE